MRSLSSLRPLNVALLLLASLSLTTPVFAQERLLRTITVTGRGVEDVQTTLTQVRLGVEFQGKTADAVQQEVARRSTAVVNLLRSRGVTKLETAGVSLNPNYNYDNNRQQLIGFIGSNVVSFQIPTEQAGPLIDEAVRAGASRVDGLNFIASEDALGLGRQQALREATQDAQAQATAVLGNLNFTQREIVSIQVNGASPPPPIFQRQLSDATKVSAESVPTPVIGGEQQVEAFVTLEISY